MSARLHHNEIRHRSHAFVQKWRDESREEAEAKSFWDAFFPVFGIDRKDVAVFEWSVAKLDNRHGFIDLFWKGVLLVEHKSRGKSLDKAESQAFEYYLGLPDKEKPNYILLSDFATFRLYDLRNKQEHSFAIEDLPERIHLFDFMSGLQHYGDATAEAALNIQAAELLGSLHDALAASGYSGHELEIFLVRILFCLFAEDTGIFPHHLFINYLLNFTTPDGSDTEMHLSKLFQVMDTPPAKRSKNLTQELNEFPYVNGHLFKERLDMPSFDAPMREVLLDGAHFDWNGISPAIFGSLFQSIMDKDARRNLGAHYTSETHILRLIKPLFLDALWAEFATIQQGDKRQVRKKLAEFQQRLTALQFLDPACGCGNFLIITYRELRRLELAVLQAQHGDRLGKTHIGGLDITVEPTIKLEHFHGIEIEEWPARIAEVAMWLTQHQMNREFARQFGREPDLLPLKTAAHITIGNALHLDWNSIAPRQSLAHLIGNPPFIGKNFRTAEQNADMDNLFGKLKNYKSLDYVTCWFYKAAQFIQGTRMTVAFVSTNSITQGEQVAPLWQPLLNQGIHLHFAHRTFAWDSEARGKAAVHVVIVGFAAFDTDGKRIFDYPAIKGEPVEITASNINPYLIDAPDIVVDNRTKPLCNVSEIVYGNKPVDGGFLLLSPEEKIGLLAKEPRAEKWLRPLLGAEEFINGKERWCLWLVGIQPNELRTLTEIMKRVEQVKAFRLASSKAQTRDKASESAFFVENRQPHSDYILVPRVSSERRDYVPMGFLDQNTISTDLNNMIPNATLYEFGVLESKMNMVWLATVGGKMKSDYRYSAKLVYNNFPWPDADAKQREKVEAAAQAVLDARENYPISTLADMYDPRSMPPDLRKAHKALDKAVEQAYRKEKFADDMARLGYLFGQYQALVGNSSN